MIHYVNPEAEIIANKKGISINDNIVYVKNNKMLFGVENILFSRKSINPISGEKTKHKKKIVVVNTTLYSYVNIDEIRKI